MKYRYVIYVWFEDGRYRELRNLKPRLYMSGYSKKEIFKYISNELYWEDIKPELVDCIGMKDTHLHTDTIIWQREDD